MVHDEKPKNALSRRRECYEAHVKVRSFAKDLLTWQTKREEIERMNAGGRKGEDKDDDEMKKRKRNEKYERQKKKLYPTQRSLESRKVELLDELIFPSMANLTVLLEAIAKGPFASKMFEDDLKGLFFSEHLIKEAYKIEEGDKKGKVHPVELAPPVLARFIEAVCATMPLPDPRLVVLDIMQHSVFNWIQEPAGIKFHAKFDDLTFAINKMVPDIGSARSWTTLLSLEGYKQLKSDFHVDHRPALF